MILNALKPLDFNLIKNLWHNLDMQVQEKKISEKAEVNQGLNGQKKAAKFITYWLNQCPDDL